MQLKEQVRMLQSKIDEFKVCILPPFSAELISAMQMCQHNIELKDTATQTCQPGMKDETFASHKSLSDIPEVTLYDNVCFLFFSCIF